MVLIEILQLTNFYIRYLLSFCLFPKNFSVPRCYLLSSKVGLNVVLHFSDDFSRGEKVKELETIDIFKTVFLTIG